MTYNEMKERAKELGVDFTGQPSKDDLEKWITEAEAKLGGIDPVTAEEAEAKAKLAAEEAAMAAKEAKFEKPEKPVVAQVSANKANPLRNAMKMVKVNLDEEIISPKDLYEYMQFKYKTNEEFTKQVIRDWMFGKISDDFQLSKNVSHR